MYSWLNSHFSIGQKDFKENKAGKEEGNITIFCTPTIYMPGHWGQTHNPANLNSSSDRRYTWVCQLAACSPELAGHARGEGSEDGSLEHANLPTAKRRERSWYLQSPKHKSQGSGGAGGAGGRRGGRLKLCLNTEETGRRRCWVKSGNKHLLSPLVHSKVSRVC